MTKENQEHVLYRLFDLNLNLLYVGITMNPAARINQHKSDKSWWYEVSSVQLERFATREELCAAEKLAIKDEKPKYNVIHNNNVRYACHMCSRKIGKASMHVLLDKDSLVVCIQCASDRGKQAHKKLYPECSISWHDLQDHPLKYATYAAARQIIPNKRAETVQTKTYTGSDLVGKFFHTVTTCPCGGDVAELQGRVVSAVADELLLIEVFEWVMGEPWGKELITLSDLTRRRPIFYDDSNEMRFSIEHGRLSHSRNNDRCHQKTAGV